MTTILFATDGSDAAEAAQRAAIQLAVDRRATLRCVGVDDALDRSGLDPAPLAAAETAAQAARLAGVEAGAERRVGPAVDRILEAAADAGADLIVVGSRGHGRLRRAILGSVSGALVRKSRVPVVVVRGDHPDAPAADAGASVASTPLASLALPGIAAEDVRVEVDGWSLVVRAERHEARDGRQLDETVVGRLALPAGVAPDDVTAELEDGVLVLRMSPTCTPRAQVIPVRAVAPVA